MHWHGFRMADSTRGLYKYLNARQYNSTPYIYTYAYIYTHTNIYSYRYIYACSYTDNCFVAGVVVRRV